MPWSVMVCEGTYPVMPVDQGPRLMGWRLGRRMAMPEGPPLTYILDPDYPGQAKAMYYEEIVPVMRDDVAQALVEAGVDNIQYAPAVLIDPRDGRRYEDYRAYNIVGTVAAADGAASTVMVPADVMLAKTTFAGLVLDESRIPEHLLIFRLQESLNAVVVHDRVRRSIEARGIPGFVFYGPGTWSG